MVCDDDSVRGAGSVVDMSTDGEVMGSSFIEDVTRDVVAVTGLKSEFESSGNT